MQINPMGQTALYDAIYKGNQILLNLYESIDNFKKAD